MKDARNAASACIGDIIAMGSDILGEDALSFLQVKALPFIQANLPSVHYRVLECYALVLTIARFVSWYSFMGLLVSQFCELVPQEILSIQEIKEFFSTTWGPTVVQLHLLVEEY